MPSLISVQLPKINAGAPLELCLWLEKLLAARLSPRQLSHIKKFALKDNALALRLSGLLARWAALLQSGATLMDMDARHRPILYGSDLSVCFSHSGAAAFCALHPMPVSMDAERIDNPDRGAIFHWLRKFAHFPSPDDSEDLLKVWTIHEAAIKIFGACFMVAFPAILESRHFWKNLENNVISFDDKLFFWRLIRWNDHLICLGTPDTPVDDIHLKLMEPPLPRHIAPAQA